MRIPKIEDLVKLERGITIFGKVAEISEVRTVTVKRDNTEHSIIDILVGDETGCIIMTLWDENISKITGYNSYLFRNCHTQTFQKSLTLALARNGSIERVERDMSVNLLNNLSLLPID